MQQRKVLKAVIAFVVIVGVMGLCGVIAHSFYVEFVYKRTPEYVHQNLTPPYEEAAKEFFDSYKSDLLQLSDLQDTLAEDTTYYYRFNGESTEAYQEHVDEIPDNFLDVLQKIEMKTSEGYYVVASKAYINIYIASSTNFDVFLYYGKSFSGRNHKTTQLEGGWTIEAPYTIRG